MTQAPFVVFILQQRNKPSPELAIIIPYPTRASGIIVLFKMPQDIRQIFQPRSRAFFVPGGSDPSLLWEDERPWEQGCVQFVFET